MQRKQDGTFTTADIVTRSPVMQPVLRAADKAASSTIPVLVQGESGTGKELIARAIHGSSARNGKPFVAVNCGALPENLVESILFGHEKGAFTGATEKHAGKFAEADGGTLFLDEVGELPLAVQVKLLRALQQNEIEPVGGRKPVKVDVRIISATHRDLIADVKSGRFREDLFYRLHVFPISVPPLRERPDDIAELARHFLTRIAAEEGKRVRMIGADAMALLASHRWPGNVRQLENAIFRAVVLAEGEEIGAAEFPQISAQVDEAPVQPGLDPQPVFITEPQPSPARPEPQGPTLRLTDAAGAVRPLEEIEREVIRFAIAHHRGQMSEVARRLKIGRSTLYRKLEEVTESEPG
jgi:DNA-binding NtrC family response regulator